MIRRMPETTDEKMGLLQRGAEAIYSVDELRGKLGEGRPLRIKLGMDPTAPDIHLGHAVVLRKMRQFQDLGHKAVLIIGDYTALIGDPSGRDTTRPVLSEAEVEANAGTYLEQAGLILDTAPEKLEVRRNSEWLGELTFADVLKLTGEMTVQQMLHRENFRKRMEADREIIVTELLYPLMQAYDSVVIASDVELGGTDQTFNNLCGRELMAKRGLERQVVLVMPILTGLDGREKMSKSKGNYVGLTESPDEMYGKLMSIPDALMPNYFELLTGLPAERMKSLLDAGQTHPRQAKDALARIVVESLHSREAANAAAEEFTRRFAEGQLPSELETKTVVGSGPTPLAKVMVEVGFASSNSEARRLIKQGAVSWDEQKLSDPQAEVNVTEAPALLKVGKRRVCRVRSG
jgi:tyrosyl-tRNA synthetase